jgi:Tfp pilus assembly protein FimT
VERKSTILSAKRDSGFSITETLIVMTVLVIIGVVALPQVISSRRLLRFAGLSREISSQIRFTRQQAISQRQVFRLRYDNVNKQLVIIDNQERGTVANPLANNTANDVIVKTIPLASTGVPATEIVYGRPTGAPSSLSDGSSMTALTNNQVEIIFQPDGSILDANGNPSSAALFLYDSKAPDSTAIAISVIGAGGRVKTWRYNKNANTFRY